MSAETTAREPDYAAGIAVAVVADTHVPDRARQLHPALLPALQEAEPAAILHAGDISVQRVLDQLGTVAPVLAVRGNRDFLFPGSLPRARSLEFAGVPLALMHGHGTWTTYLVDKLFYLTQGYRLQRYQAIMAGMVASAKVIVFGHTHRPEVTWMGGKLWFNPGSACIPMRGSPDPSFGLLHFSAAGEVSGEIIALTGARLNQYEWQID